MNPAYCTDTRWLGRSECQHCVVRHLMTFSVLPEEAFTSTLMPIDHFIVNKNSILFSEGEKGEHVFSIRKGWVKIIMSDEDGLERIVRLIGPGGLLGLELILPSMQGRYGHNAITHGEVDVCRIPLNVLCELEVKHPELYLSVFQRCAEQAMLADNVIISFTSGSLHKRIEHVLVYLASNTSDEQGRFLKMSVADMAAWVGGERGVCQSCLG